MHVAPRGRLMMLALLAASAGTGASAPAPLDMRQIDIHVDGGRPIAGERSRFAVSPDGEVAFTYSLVAGGHACMPCGVLGTDGQIRLSALESETTWNVEGWGNWGWPFDLIYAGPGDLRYAVRYHGKPYGVDYWHRVDGVWKLETFGAGVSYGGNDVALGLLPDKRPVIVALDANRTQLRVWERSDGGQWSSTTPPELSGVAGGDFDLVGRGDGSLLVLWCPAGGCPVCAKRGPDGTWRRATVDEAGQSRMVALALDRTHRTYATYAVGPTPGDVRQLRLATLEGGKWTVRTVAEAPEGRHVGRTDIAVASGTVAIVWELGLGPRFVPKDYGNTVGGIMLTLVDDTGGVTTQQLVEEHAGRPSIALSPDGNAAYVGVYTGNDAGDDFRLLALGLNGNPAPDLRPPTESPEQVFTMGCVNEIRSGNANAEKRGMSRIDTALVAPEERVELIDRFLSAEDFELRVHAARELAKSPDVQVRFADGLRGVVSDPNHAVRHAFFANLLLDDVSAKAVMPVLYESLTSTDAINRLGAAEALSRYRDRVDADQLRVGVEALTTGLGDRDQSRGGSASMALEHLGGFASVERALRRAMLEAGALASARAALVLWRLGKPIDETALKAAMASGDEEAQLAICGLCREIRSGDCLPPLMRALASKHASVRTSAIFALRSLAMVAEMKPVAKHPNGIDLFALRRREPGDHEERATSEAAADALIAALSHDDPNVRAKACDALSRAGVSRAVPDIRRLASDPDQGARLAAKTAAGVLADASPAEFLVNLREWTEGAASRQPRRRNPVCRKPTEVCDGVVLVGTDKQLFLDDFLIESAEGLTRQLHPFEKHPRNPIFHAQVPWEEGWVDPFMSTVLYDEDERCYKLWYRCGPRHSLTGYAVSEDGIHWVRPNTASRPWQQWEQHNLVGFEGQVGIWKCPGRNVVRRSAVGHAKRYSSFFYRPDDKKYVVSYSPEGLTWTQPEVARQAYGDVVSLVWDAAREHYLLFPKYMTKSDGFTRRSFAAFEVESMTAEAPRAMPFVPGLREDAGVAAAASRAFGSLLPDTMRLSEFHAETYSVTPLPYEGMVLALYDLWPVIGTREGPLDMLMKVSRDMTTWEDVCYPQRALSLGRFGEWDSGMVYGANTMLVIDDEIRLYYLGASRGHCTKELPLTKPSHTLGMGLATLRLDGFASMRARTEVGVLTTKPLQFAGDRLEVNVDCREGALRVEVLDADGIAIEGFGRGDSDPFSGDELRHVVTWKGSSDVSPLAGRTIRIRLALRGGDLYAFQFRR